MRIANAPQCSGTYAGVGLPVSHTSIGRWAQTYGPEVLRRLRGQVKRTSTTCHMDETFVRIAGRWISLFRAVDSYGQTVDLFIGDARAGSRKDLLKEGLSQCRQPNASR